MYSCILNLFIEILVTRKVIDMRPSRKIAGNPAINTPVDTLQETSALKSFHLLTREEKLRHLSSLSISVSTSNIEDIDSLFTELSSIGFTPVRINKILLCLAYIIKTEGISIPTEKKNRHHKETIVQDLLNRIQLQSSDENNLEVYTALVGSNQDIGELAEKDSKDLQPLVQLIILNKIAFSSVLEFIKSFFKQRALFALEQINPAQIPINGPRLAIVSEDVAVKPTIKQKVDTVITYGKSGSILHATKKELITHSAFNMRRQQLEKAIHKGEITIYPKFSLDAWPYDPLMKHLRNQVSPLIQDYILKHSAFCDPLDLKYQTIFRLTTYDIAEIFEDGGVLEEYLHKVGIYKNWRNILRVDSSIVDKFHLKEKLVSNVIHEQYAVIRHRLEKSMLPLDVILNPTGIFSEQGWVIQKSPDGIFAAQEERGISFTNSVPLEFKEIDPNLAMQFHNDFHYIHASRADKAFALYVKGEAMPFSVLAIELVDRIYKQNVLLLHGYDPRKCYDFTRMYSKPGTPGNTSSSMLSLAFSYLKANYPETQATLSSFMPTHASGVSMTAGGFNNPVLVKPLTHTFVEKTIDGTSCYEHITSRRTATEVGKKIWNKIPLLPTVELLGAIQPPRYPPISGSDKWMIEIF